MVASVWRVEAAAGADVRAGDPLVALEAKVTSMFHNLHYVIFFVGGWVQG